MSGPPLLSPSYKYRLGPHPPPPTPGALRKVRGSRAGQRERKGDGARQVTAVAPAVRQPPQLEASLPAAPAPSAPLPPAPRADSSPRAVRAWADLPGPGPLLQSQQMRAGGRRFRTGRGRERAGLAGFSLASQQLSSLPGGAGMDRLLKPTIREGTREVPRWEILRELQTF